MSGVVRTLAAIACAVLVVGALVVGGLAWRLARGPIRLGFLTPRIESALSAADGSARVDIGATWLEWDPADRDLDVRVNDLRVLGRDAVPLARISSLAVGLAPASLVLGRAAPRSVEAIGTHIEVVHQPDGRIEIGIGGDPSPAATQLLMGALAGGAPRASLGALRTISLRDGEITLDDRASGTTWQATNAALIARRVPTGVTVERLAFDVAPASIVASGRVHGGAIELDATVHTLPTHLVERWWPVDVAPATRRWVLANVSRGGVTGGRALVTATLTTQGAPQVTLGRVDGRVAFAGLAVRWRDGVPPLTGVAGIGTFSREGWQLRIARGEIEGLDVVRAQVAPATGGAPAVAVDTVVRGPLSKVLALLEKPALRAAASLPFRPGEISGGTTAHVTLRVPLDGGAAAIRADGDLRSVSMRRAYRGRNVNARRLRFALDEHEFEMRGEITIGRAPLQLRWHDVLAGAARGRRTISVKGTLDADGRQALGADLGSWLEGPVDVHAHLAPKTQGATSLNLLIDLTPASINVPLINVVKDAGAPGWSDARVLLEGGKITAVDAFHLEAAGASMSGHALFAPDETLRSGDGTIDMPPRSEGGPSGLVQIALKPAGTGSEIAVTSDDPGIAFRAIDSYADATGGRMKLAGTVRLGVPGVPMMATLTADGFVLRRSPIVAKIAALGSVGGVIDLLAADGLPFSQLVATFTQRAGVVTLTESVAASPGLALTARGSVDRAGDELSLDGTMVPNYAGLARLIQAVPDLGNVVSTLGNEQVRALDYSVSGSLTDPYVTAKPATGISPAALRSLERLTTTRVDLTRPASRKGKSEEEDIDAGAAPRKRRSGASKSAGRGRTDTATSAPTRSRVRRRAGAGPAERDTDTE